MHVLTKYATKKGIKTKVESDHNLLICEINVAYQRKVPEKRREIFNFKNKEGMKKFKEKTTSNESLVSCFDGLGSIEMKTVKFLYMILNKKIFE